MSVSGIISAKGEELRRVELKLESKEGTEYLSDLVIQLRSLQDDTNKFLTDLIASEKGGAGAGEGEDTLTEEDVESDSEDDEEPEAKHPKLD